MRLFTDWFKWSFLYQCKTCIAQLINKYLFNFLQTFLLFGIFIKGKYLAYHFFTQSSLLIVENFIDSVINNFSLLTNKRLVGFNAQLIQPQLFEHIDLIAGRFLCHFTKHECPDLVIHNHAVIRIRFHVHYQIWFEIFDEQEHNLSHYFQYFELKRRTAIAHCFKIQSIEVRVVSGAFIFWHDWVSGMFVNLDVL